MSVSKTVFTIDRIGPFKPMILQTIYPCLSVSLFACLSTKHFYLGHYFWLVSVGAFVFHVCSLWQNPFSLVLKSRSSVKVNGRIAVRTLVLYTDSRISRY